MTEKELYSYSEHWVEKGIITSEQRKQIIEDAGKRREERASSRLVGVIATIGALSVGISGMLWMAANWSHMDKLIKLLLIAIGLFGVLGSGWYLKYVKGTWLRVGGALIFLSALLFGVAVMLIGQMYHMGGSLSDLLLFWIIGVLPLVYLERSTALTVIPTALVLVWVGAYPSEHHLNISGGSFASLWGATGIALFAAGSLHYLRPGFEKLARVMRLLGMVVAIGSVFLMTFRDFSGAHSWWGGYSNVSNFAGTASVIALALSALPFLVPKLHTRDERIAAIASSILGVFFAAFCFFPPTAEDYTYTIFANILYILTIGAVFFVGYKREDMSVINWGVSFTFIFILARYFSWFWSLMEGSTFFLIGGVLLLSLGFIMENRRRDLRRKFHVHDDDITAIAAS